jgi:hypothetical protein
VTIYENNISKRSTNEYLRKHCDHGSFDPKEAFSQAPQEGNLPLLAGTWVKAPMSSEL